MAPRVQLPYCCHTRFTSGPVQSRSSKIGALHVCQFVEVLLMPGMRHVHLFNDDLHLALLKETVLQVSNTLWVLAQ